MSIYFKNRLVLAVGTANQKQHTIAQSVSLLNRAEKTWYLFILFAVLFV